MSRARDGRKERCFVVRTEDGAEMRVHAAKPPSKETIAALSAIMRSAYRRIPPLRRDRWLDYDLGGEGGD